jgi:hypothetical protein
MQRILASVLLILLPLSAAADGKVFPSVLEAEVKIPDQRALIHFTNGVERLVIETRFTGSGTDFAWVVPLPSQPVVEEASTGLFPTLQFLFRPQITHSVPRYYLWILAIVGLACVVVWAAKSVWHGFLVCLLFLLLAALLLPALGTASRSAGFSSSPTAGVSILDRQLVGVFETTTISSREPKALQSWLRENGFVVSSNSDPVIESYVRDGWVFVAAKVRRDKSDAETSTPHPLSFTFKTDRAVYPMRLTGVDSDSLQVDLYVFGPARAKASRFRTERCTMPRYPGPPSYWSHGLPKTPEIVHPLLREWVDGSPVATKLTARLSPVAMKEDVWLDWMPYSEQTRQIFSHTGAWTRALNFGSGTLAAGLFFLWLFSITEEGRGRHWAGPRKGIVLLSLVVTGSVYLALPKTQVRLIKYPSSTAQNNLYELYFALDGNTNRSIHDEARDLSHNLTNGTFRLNLLARGTPADRENHLLGGLMREEDSPGNFVLRKTNGLMHFIAYDSRGAEYLMGTWAAPPD